MPMRKKIQTNLDRLQYGSADDVAEILERISKCDIAQEVDWESWLSQPDNSGFVPRDAVRQQIEVTTWYDGHAVDINEYDAYILDDDVRMFGARYLRFWDGISERVRVVPYESVEFVEEGVRDESEV